MYENADQNNTEQGHFLRTVQTDLCFLEIDIVSTIDEVKYNKTQKSKLSYTFNLLQVVQKTSKFKIKMITTGLFTKGLINPQSTEYCISIKAYQ